ncbi:MAG: KamA family radical SAM protein [Nitrospirota bacterium]|nr:KamA family radical SAM protein [Nitrospirota bacterium]
MQKKEPAFPSPTTDSASSAVRLAGFQFPTDTPSWRDWKWQIANRLTRLEQLEEAIRLTPSEREGIRLSGGRLSMGITPYYASLIDPLDPDCPIRRQAIPSAEEFTNSPYGMVDPLAEDSHSPVPGLVHRYPDRALLLISSHCAMYCRYCTRRRMVGEHGRAIPPQRLDEALDYLRSHGTIRDIIISGGDPLMLDDDVLEYVISSLRAIPHIEIIRIGTRMPVTLPYRITDDLCAMLRKYHPLYMSLHFTHPRDITPDVAEACGKLADAGIPLGSQTVLLKGINDSTAIIRELMHGLLKIRVRPYYLYQCDQVIGTGHFQTPVATGIRIMQELRGHTSGYAIPTFVIDAPGGGGKIPLNPDYVVASEDGRLILRNFEDRLFEYRESSHDFMLDNE